jgi:hypothetical protein
MKPESSSPATRRMFTLTREVPVRSVPGLTLCRGRASARPADLKIGRYMVKKGSGSEPGFDPISSRGIGNKGLTLDYTPGCRFQR